MDLMQCRACELCSPVSLAVDPSSSQAQGSSCEDRREHSGPSQLFHRCQRAVQALPSQARRTCSEQEERLLRNVVASLAQVLQELSSGFRHAQAGYLKRECGLSPGLKNLTSA